MGQEPSLELTEQRAMLNKPGSSASGVQHPLRLVVIEPSRSPQLIEYLEEYPVEILGLADLDLGSPIMSRAKEKGILVTQDYPELLELRDLDLIINLSPDRTVQIVTEQIKPQGARVVQPGHRAFLTAPVREWLLSRALQEILKLLSNCISGISTPKEVSRGILKNMMFLCSAQAGGLWLRQGKEFILFLQEGLPDGLETQLRGEMGQRALGFLLEEKRVVRMKDLQTQVELPGRESFLCFGLKGLILVPMLKNGEVTGALLLMASRSLPEELDIVAGVLQAVVGLLAEAMEKAVRSTESRQVSTRDELTGLRNQAYFQDRLEDQMAQAWRDCLPLCVICVKTTLQEAKGSMDSSLLALLLRQCAREIEGCIRKMDVPARFREGEFFILLPGAGSREALEIGRRILARLERLEWKRRQGATLECSAGLACFPEHGTCSRELLDKAGWAAHQASKEAPGRILFCPRADQEWLLAEPHQISVKYPSLKELLEFLGELWEKHEESWCHARGVAYYAGRIGLSLGLDEEALLQLQVSGWFHDIGKMGTYFPKARLPEHFPGLARVDREIHAPIGAFILKNFLSSEAVLKGVFHHHDRFDGLNKPSGKKGEEIPLEGRILALADAYQHLLAQAKPSQGRQGVFSKLREMAGKQLDPRLVETLTRSEAEALDLRQSDRALPTRRRRRENQRFTGQEVP